MELIAHEIYRLIDDYYKCENLQIKEQLMRDIILLSEAYLLYIDKKK